MAAVDESLPTTAVDPVAGRHWRDDEKRLALHTHAHLLTSLLL